MIPKLPLSSYRIFNTVAELGNITKASKELFISQPAISKSISKLEQELCVTLFTRNSRGVNLTEEGQLLYDYTKEAFLTLSQGEQKIHQFHSLGIGHLKIGASNTLCKYLLLPYLKEFIALYPHIRFTIQCQSSLQTLHLLSDGKVDLGLIGHSSIPKSIVFSCIGSIEDIFVVSPSYLSNLKLREGSQKTTADLLESATIMLLDEKNLTRQHIEEYLTAKNIRINQLLEVSSMDLLIDFAKTGLGIARVLREFVKQELKDHVFVELPLCEPICSREVGFAYDMKHGLTEPAQKFLDFIHSSRKPCDRK